MTPKSNTYIISRFLNYIVVFFISGIIISCCSCTKEELFLDITTHSLPLVDSVDIIAYCPFPHCDIVFQEVKQQYQALANERQEDILIPVECCYDTGAAFALVKVSPSIKVIDWIQKDR